MKINIKNISKFIKNINESFMSAYKMIYNTWFPVPNEYKEVEKSTNTKENGFIDRILLEVKSVKGTFSKKFVKKLKDQIEKESLNLTNFTLVIFTKQKNKESNDILLHKEFKSIKEVKTQLEFFIISFTIEGFGNKIYSSRFSNDPNNSGFDLYILIINTSKVKDISVRYLKNIKKLQSLNYNSYSFAYVKFETKIFICHILDEIGKQLKFNYKKLPDNYAAVIINIESELDFYDKNYDRAYFVENEFKLNQDNKSFTKFIYLPLDVLKSEVDYVDPLLNNPKIVKFLDESTLRVKECFEKYDATGVKINKVEVIFSLKDNIKL